MDLPERGSTYNPAPPGCAAQALLVVFQLILCPEPGEMPSFFILEISGKGAAAALFRASALSDAETPKTRANCEKCEQVREPITRTGQGSLADLSRSRDGPPFPSSFSFRQQGRRRPRLRDRPCPPMSRGGRLGALHGSAAHRLLLKPSKKPPGPVLPHLMER